MWPDKGWMPWMLPPGVCRAAVVYEIRYNIKYYWNAVIGTLDPTLRDVTISIPKSFLKNLLNKFHTFPIYFPSRKGNSMLSYIYH